MKDRTPPEIELPYITCWSLATMTGEAWQTCKHSADEPYGCDLRAVGLSRYKMDEPSKRAKADHERYWRRHIQRKAMHMSKQTAVLRMLVIGMIGLNVCLAVVDLIAIHSYVYMTISAVAAAVCALAVLMIDIRWRKLRRAFKDVQKEGSR